MRLVSKTSIGAGRVGVTQLSVILKIQRKAAFIQTVKDKENFLVFVIISQVCFHFEVLEKLRQAELFSFHQVQLSEWKRIHKHYILISAALNPIHYEFLHWNCFPNACNSLSQDTFDGSVSSDECLKMSLHLTGMSTVGFLRNAVSICLTSCSLLTFSLSPSVMYSSVKMSFRNVGCDCLTCHCECTEIWLSVLIYILVGSSWLNWNGLLIQQCCSCETCENTLTMKVYDWTMMQNTLLSKDLGSDKWITLFWKDA